MKTNKIIFIFALASLTLTSCKSIGGGKGFNLFPVSQDKALGAQVAAEIDGNQQQYPLLDSTQYSDVYRYIYGIRDKILNSGKVTLKDEFPWRLRIIHNDSTLNAFCTPGGYIYIYTGILKYLDSEDQFAGVLAHEIAHADKRHSTRQMTQKLGVQIVLDVFAGDRAALKQVTAGLLGLRFSRKHESEADQCSVEYLCPTEYNAAGGAGFFEKIQAAGGARTPEFLSTHPNPVNRIEHFKSAKTSLGCQGNATNVTEYQKMKARLPR